MIVFENRTQNVQLHEVVIRSKRTGDVLHEVLTKLREVFAAYLNVREHFVLERGNFWKYTRMSDERNGTAITEDEAALYDRQIRLWGLDAQKRYKTCMIEVMIQGRNCQMYCVRSASNNIYLSTVNLKLKVWGVVSQARSEPHCF